MFFQYSTYLSAYLASSASLLLCTHGRTGDLHLQDNRRESTLKSGNIYALRTAHEYKRRTTENRGKQVKARDQTDGHRKSEDKTTSHSLLYAVRCMFTGKQQYKLCAAAPRLSVAHRSKASLGLTGIAYGVCLGVVRCGKP